MLSIEGFKHQIDNIEHQTFMYNTYKFDSFLKSVENSKQVLINNFIEQQKLIEKINIYEAALNQIVEIGRKTYKTESEMIAEIALNTIEI